VDRVDIGIIKGGKMKTVKEQLPTLKIWERIIGFYISVVLLLCAAVLLFHPPLSITITEKNGTVVNANMVESSNAIESTRTSSNPSTVIIILLAAGCIFTFYSINGLRFTKILIGKDSVEASCNVVTTPETEDGFKPIKQKLSLNVEELENRKPDATNRPDDSNVVGTDDQAKEQFQNKSFFERKILNTLWRYQQRYTSPDEHWTFTLYNNHPEYANFQGAIAKLIESKLVYFDMNTEQYSLTYDGIEFMKKAKAEPAEEGEFYPFIVKGYR
jgi:hypothetical protein